MTDLTALETRQALPEPLRVLLADYPRDLWQAHANFDGLTRFWLERHLMFRQLLERLQGEAEAVLDRRADPLRYQRDTARLAGFFLNQLHNHHMIEDHHYFPQLAALESPLERGFEILDHDHHVLDGHIHALAERINAMLRRPPDALHDAAGALHEALKGFAPFLDRHLWDEEELIVPVILKHGAALEG